ncbi:MAG: hypothetical protein HY927_15355 [Elusimicrobia bacterium]|nr:hypothetical protein [Elusimicrobiota bacterium]
MEDRPARSSKRSNPKEVTAMALFVLAVPLLLLALAVVAASVLLPVMAAGASLLSGRFGHAVLWAAVGVFFLWANYRALGWLRRRRSAPRQRSFTPG